MVDLVKIRKKAKRSADVSSARAPEPPAPEPPPAPPADETSALQKFRETAGIQREGLTLAVDEREQTEGSQLELLTFSIAGEQYAVGIERIIEIVRPRPVTRIPNADASVVGIISLRGTIVTIVDVRRRLRHRAERDERADPRIVVVEFSGETLGFEVDRVSRVVRVPAGSIEPHPVVHASELSEAIRGVFRSGGALTILLDLDKLLDSRVTRIHGTDV
jgi:purine-binding chemotaxis protein CheW